MLVHHAVDEARRLGERCHFSACCSKNAANINLMKKCGFELWGRLPEVASIDGELVSHLYYGRKV